MSLILDDGLTELRASLQGFLDDRCPPSAVRSVVAGDTTTAEDLWGRLVGEFELGGLAVPRQYGGDEAGYRARGVVLEELGARLAPVPYLGTAVLACDTVLAAGDEAACAELLPTLADGRRRGAVAFAEGSDQRWPVADLVTVAHRAGQQWIVNGRKVFAMDAGAADWVVVSAVRDGDGSLGLFVVELPCPGVVLTELPGADLTRSYWSIVLEEAPAWLLECDDPAQALSAVRDRALLGLAAEALGGIRHCVTATVDYCMVRYQFGRPIGSFQAVKHRCADMHTKLELATAAVRRAEEVADSGEPGLIEAVLVAHSLATRYFLDVAEDMVHLHGGIGFTWEHDAHLYLRRAIASALVLGTPECSLELLADRLGL